MAIWKNRLNGGIKSGVENFASAFGFKPPAWEGLAVKFADLFLISFFAQLFLYPILAQYFHKISAVSLLSNVILVPASGLAMALGFLMALFSGAGFVFRFFNYTNIKLKTNLRASLWYTFELQIFKNKPTFVIKVGSFLLRS